MAPAASVKEAAYRNFLHWDRGVGGDDQGDTSAIYVNRYTGGDPKRGKIPVFTRIKQMLLNEQGHLTVLLSGQVGSGKSTELRKLLDDVEVRQRFECVIGKLPEELNAVGAGAFRVLLVSLCALVARHLDERKFTSSARWETAVSGLTFEGWVRLLKRTGNLPEAPTHADFEGAIKTPVLELSARLLGDGEIRKRLLDAQEFTAEAWIRLLSEMLDVLEKVGGRPVLLVLDEGDKVRNADAAREVFVSHHSMLSSLPCRTVVTFPYWLHFDPAFNPIYGEGRVHVLRNIKVVDRRPTEERDTTPLLPGGREFFFNMYRRLVASGAALIESDEVLERAIRLSAGVPREFMRVLQKGFEFASIYEESVLTLATLDEAIEELRYGVQATIQREDVRRSLQRIALTNELSTAEDWSRINEMLAIEYVNSGPWYDVHPLLAESILTRNRELAERLKRAGVRDAEELRSKMLSELAPTASR